MTPITIQGITYTTLTDIRSWWRSVERSHTYSNAWYIYGIATDRRTGQKKWAVISEGLTKTMANDLMLELRPRFICFPQYKNATLHMSNVYTNPFDYEKCTGIHNQRAYALQDLICQIQRHTAS